MDIRKEFIEFFKEKGHSEIKSSPLVPNDNSLLFTNAGMVQFKDIFIGNVPIPENRRATSSQTCLRAGGKHNDLENVGQTARHHTFFEMLGNFSFGDYFKEEAISFAWEFITKKLKFPVEKLWVTIHNSDDEAFNIWKKFISEDRIKRFGDKDNFWQMGDTGPCGPSSEIFYDQGSEKFNSKNDFLGGDGDRFLEIWNLVFMQYDRDIKGNLTPLPKPSIDTGMGLERVVAIQEGKTNNFHSSLFFPIIEKISTLINKNYNPEKGVSFRVIADHIRAVTFLLAQGVRFDREGRGYVMRRILRRAVRHGYLLGFKSPFMFKLVDTVIELFGNHYTYLNREKNRIIKALQKEEERFFSTIEGGIKLFEENLNLTNRVFSGEIAFKLYDTYGFPLDLTEDMLKDKGIKVDKTVFNRLMEQQKERAKANWKGSGDSINRGNFREILEEFGVNNFIGYNYTFSRSIILALFDENFNRIQKIESNKIGWVMFDNTPFYAESGGQIGDKGKILNFGKIIDTQKFLGLNLSKVELQESLKVGQLVSIEVDSTRLEIAKHHSATHLLHSALRKFLGDEVAQAGSSVNQNRLRFDFSYDSVVNSQLLTKIESYVNDLILKSIPQVTQEMSIQEAKNRGAIALFGEKYGDKVRVVAFDNDSIELCGGTHVNNSSQIGIFLIIKESGVSAGIRRIEAICGKSALNYIKKQQFEINQALTKLKSQNLNSGIEKLQKNIFDLKNEIRELQNSQKQEFKSEKIGDTEIIISELKSGDIKNSIDEIKNRYNSVAVMLFQKKGDKILIASGSKNSLIHAGNWIKQVAPILGGGGGGRPDFAQAGGKDLSKLNDAFKIALEFIQAKLKV